MIYGDKKNEEKIQEKCIVFYLWETCLMLGYSHFQSKKAVLFSFDLKRMTVKSGN